MENEVREIEETLKTIHYDTKLFEIGFGENSYVFGAILKEQPGFCEYFSYKTLYDSIIDIDKKIKHSVCMGLQRAEIPVGNNWNPFERPTASEWEAMYYAENALFRVSVLWDLLAQLFNIKEGLGKRNDKVYAEQVFHDAQQGAKPNLFAKKVYEYMKEDDDVESEPWRGHYTFLKEYRNKMTHRYSLSVSTLSNYAIDIRLPAIYYLYRITMDYKQVSVFIHELIDRIINKDISSITNNCEDIGHA